MYILTLKNPHSPTPIIAQYTFRKLSDIHEYLKMTNFFTAMDLHLIKHGYPPTGLKTPSTSRLFQLVHGMKLNNIYKEYSHAHFIEVHQWMLNPIQPPFNQPQPFTQPQVVTN